MADSETAYIVELQPRIIQRLHELGFSGNAQAQAQTNVLAHGLAELASRSRTFDQEALPLFLSLDALHRRSLAEVTVALKNHMDAMQDAITDVQSSLAALIDFLSRDVQ
jgi:hypothetical protein